MLSLIVAYTHIFGKFAAVSRRIRQTSPWNLDKFATENGGPYTSAFRSVIHNGRNCIIKFVIIVIFTVIDLVKYYF